MSPPCPHPNALRGVPSHVQRLQDTELLLLTMHISPGSRPQSFDLYLSLAPEVVPEEIALSQLWRILFNQLDQLLVHAVHPFALPRVERETEGVAVSHQIDGLRAGGKLHIVVMLNTAEKTVKVRKTSMWDLRPA